MSINRIPKTAFITKGSGSSNLTIHAGSYHKALFDADISLILNELIKFDKSSLRHLDLSRNHIEIATAQSLITLLQSEKTYLNTLKLNDCAIRHDQLDILNEEFKRNQSLELVEIKNIDFLPHDHPIRDTKKVKFT